MVPRYWLAPLSLFVLQHVPIAVVPDSSGRYRIAVGGAFGSYRERLVSCAGDLLDREQVPFRTFGGEVEGWVSPTVRITGHAGRMSATPAEGGRIARPFQGFFGGAMVAAEGEKIGAGLGLSAAPAGANSSTGAGTRAAALGYLRLGRLDNTHFRVGVGGPATPGGPPDLVRVGIGRGLGRVRQVGWELYTGAADFPITGPDLVAGGQILFPVGSVFDLGLTGAYRAPSGGSVGVVVRVGFSGLGTRHSALGLTKP